MRYVSVSDTGVRVSRLCFGTLQMGPLLHPLTVMQGALLLYALERGITAFDTAKEFGTRCYLKTAFSGHEGVVVIDKSPARTYEEMERDIAESSVELEKDELDIFLLYDVRSREDFALRKGGWDYLKEAKAMGLVKAIGLSTHTVEGVQLAYELDELDFLQAVFNLTGAGILDGDLAAMEEALRKVKERGKTVCAIKPLAGGMLTRDRWQEALRFVFNHPLVDCVCVGMVTQDEVDANCAFADESNVGAFPKHTQYKFSDKVITAIAKTPKRLVILDWCTGCEGCIPVCPTQALYMKDGFARVLQERCDWCGKCGPVCPDEAIFLTAVPPSAKGKKR